MKVRLLLALLLACAAVHADHKPTLLPAQQAFSFSAVAAADGVLEVAWEIADNYYMYRDKMSFAIVGSGAITANPTLPPGKMQPDPLFGEAEVYFSTFATELAVATDGLRGYTLVARGQGCHLPTGVCYPPTSREVAFTPTTLGDSASSNAPGLVEQLHALINDGFAQPEFLDVDDAFQLAIRDGGVNRLETAFSIAEGYYLYRDKISFRSEGKVRLAEATLPPGELKDDAYFGEIAVLKQDFSAPITLQRLSPQATEIRIHASYQGCAEGGICYAPVDKTISLTLPEIIPAAFAGGDAWGESGAGSPSADGQFIRPTPTPASTTAIAASPGVLLGAFLAGLLLTFTPCVLPMLPILSGTLAGQGGNITRTRGGVLALAFVLGSMLTYAAMGALAGATGDQLQGYFQNIWAIGILSSVLVAMALSLFGFFTIRMPSSVQSGLHNKARNLSASLPLIFCLGALSAVIVGACVSPVLISFLSLAISTSDAWLGARMMAAMALGMGVPLIALGLGAGSLLPKTGRWTETVNHALGVMLIGVAIYLLGALPAVPVLLLWGGLLVIVGIRLGALRRMAADVGGWRRLGKGAGMLLLAWGLAALVGGFFGERDPLRPLPAELFATAETAQQQSAGAGAHAAPFIPVGSAAELDRQFARAAANDKLVMVEYYADWCVDCVRMEKTTFRDPRVVDELQRNFIALRIDVTDPRDRTGSILKKRFGVFGPPATLFFDRTGAPLADSHFYGYRDGDDFHALIISLAQRPAS